VRAGVTRVVIGMPDPNTGVAGGGAGFLRSAGVDVSFAEDPRPYLEQNVEWLQSLETGLPFVAVKTALTLDGRPSLAPGVRSTLTGEGARTLTMRLRAAADAVLVGAATVAIDDPALTVRDADGTAALRQPKRVVLARTELPAAGARMFHDGLGQAIVLVPEEAGQDAGLAEVAHLVEFPIAEGLRGALRALAAHGVVSLLVEAGPRMLSALWDEDLIDELVLLHAGGMAGEGAPALFVGESPRDSATLVRRFRAVEAGLAGSDAATVWRRAGTVDEDE
jgi:diaminohydroxyphosphoribosylaminopyrimidine deaminase/5-amino-6-(5-phosphoribosylamino)uracil reductase